MGPSSTFSQIFDKLWKCVDNKQNVTEILSTFSEDHTNTDRVSLALKNLQLFKLLPFNKKPIDNKEKSSELAIELRNAGNKCYAKKNPNLFEALALYTKSIAVSPGPEELSMAFANRSAVFLALKKYEACLSDINQAMMHNYPENLKYKLFERSGKCYQIMGKISEAIWKFEQTLSFIPLTTMLPERAEELVRTTLSRIESLKKETALAPLEEGGKLVKLPLPEITHGLHKDNACSSKYLDVKYCPEMGRFVEANSDINPGDILIVEKAYASVLLPENYHTHCYNCLQRYDALIPCKQCSLALYCSDNCRAKSWEHYHHIECTILPSLLQLDMGQDWILALRVILIASNRSNGLEELYKTVQTLDKKGRTSKVHVKKASFPHYDPEYSTMHYLIQNTSKRSFKDVYKLATVAACIINCMEVSNVAFLPGKSDKDSDKIEPDIMLFVGSLLLQYLQSLCCNSYSVADLVLHTTGEQLLETECFGCAVYGFSSFINHSCDPNVVRSFSNGSVMTVMATRPIKKGEQIFCDYGYAHDQYEKNDRKAYLERQYFFSCDCKACLEDWPTYSQLESVDATYICSKCRVPLPKQQGTDVVVACSVCQEKNDVSVMNSKLQEVAEGYCEIKVKLLNGSRENFVPQLGEMLIVLHNIVQRPYKYINPVQDALRHNLMQIGNFYLI